VNKVGSVDLVISEAVLDEIQRGDPEVADRRRNLVGSLPILALTDDVRVLARAYERRLGLAPAAAADVLHIAFAVAYAVDYLVTWNCKHIANGFVISRLHEVNQQIQRRTPVIVTPEELLESGARSQP
jgi:hypothetical protein